MTACGGEHSASQFKFRTDGLTPNQRDRQEYAIDTDINNDELWIPYGEGAFQACSFNVTSGGFANILRLPPGTKLNPHYHVGIVHGYTHSGPVGLSRAPLESYCRYLYL